MCPYLLVPVGTPLPTATPPTDRLPLTRLPLPPPPLPQTQSFLVTLLLFICTCTYVKMKAPQLMDSHKVGLRGLFWKAARVGERLSPWVATSCVVMGVHTFWTGGGK
jgi:hypothetical protein